MLEDNLARYETRLTVCAFICDLVECYLGNMSFACLVGWLNICLFLCFYFFVCTLCDMPHVL